MGPSHPLLAGNKNDNFIPYVQARERERDLLPHKPERQSFRVVFVRRKVRYVEFVRAREGGDKIFETAELRCVLFLFIRSKPGTSGELWINKNCGRLDSIRLDSIPSGMPTIPYHSKLVRTTSNRNTTTIPLHTITGCRDRSNSVFRSQSSSRG